MINVKSSQDIEYMRMAGRLVAECHELLAEAIKPGITTLELDKMAEDYFKKNGAVPTFLGYQGFPNSICASINGEVVHGIPNHRRLEEGDIIAIDLGATLNGFVGDAARTHGVGNISETAKKLIDVTRESFFKGIAFARQGYRLSDVSHAIQCYVEANGFSVVRDYVGHGIGREMHEDPPIPNFGKPGHGPRLCQGMCLAIEPMVNVGNYDVEVLDNDWTVVTTDGSLSAHYENTIVVTGESEPEILTML
ncbi:MAG: type I methionyl aminopeptidase [Eubacterium aggregans]|uniref:Methionine aminopeptidase n=1 Tax=Eubacterium aggregans TaxID=81409 RepID=A0A1H4DRW9_9FIRM|nr:type I methionyl aminopeptidase [Eubacterium aggregans]MEA5074685.1 type I methionyl aminopeptidase [Eubacterium aggregans]SEA75377.1 methionine aminopeptidase, type I [Eubacterium aggregans]